MKKICMIAAALILAVTTSCEHKELCYDHSHVADVQVVFDWRHAPDADPIAMLLYLFPADGSEPQPYWFSNRSGGTITGGTIRVPMGTYHAVCLNTDTENISHRNTERYETFHVTTHTTSLMSSGLSTLGVRSAGAPRAEGTEDERVALSADMLWTDHAEDIVLTLAQTTETQTITFYPQVSVSRYTVEIRNADNLQYTKGVSGSISSLAGVLQPQRGADAITDERVTIPFDGVIGEDDGGEKTIVTGELRAFGHHPREAGNKHELIVYAVLADGSKWYYTYDVTDQIHAAPDKRNVHILLDGLPLPKPIVNGGGFQPEVGDWESVDIPIEM